MVFSSQLARAKKEGRICELCGWIVSKKRWDKGYRTCASCEDARKGVNVKFGHYPPNDNPLDPPGKSRR